MATNGYLCKFCANLKTQNKFKEFANLAGRGGPEATTFRKKDGPETRSFRNTCMDGQGPEAMHFGNKGVF